MVTKRKMNKKGQLESFLLIFVMAFIIGIFLFFANHLTNAFYDEFNDYFNSSSKYNDTTAHQTVEKIQDVENSAWDYAFLAIFVGLIIQIMLFSFATQINAAFYWIMVILDVPILIIGVILSNVWQELAANATFATTIARFPITNAILGTYYPTIIVGVLFIAMIVLMGKPPGNNVT